MSGDNRTCFGEAPTIWVAAADDITIGTDGDDVIVGSGQDDVIYAGKGEDRVCARGGEDFVIGNRDADWLSGGPDGDLVAGWDGDDTVTGDGGDDVLRGNRHDDVVYADGGDDTDINLGPGSDWGFGGRGDDRMSGYGDGPDEVDNCHGGGGWDIARNCDAPVDRVTGVFDPFGRGQFEQLGPVTAH